MGPSRPFIGHILGARVSKSERRLSNNGSGLLGSRWPGRVCYYSTAATTELESAEYQNGWMNVFSSAVMLQLERSWGIKTVSSHVMEDCVAQQKSAVTDTARAKSDTGDLCPRLSWWRGDLQRGSCISLLYAYLNKQLGVILRSSNNDVLICQSV